MILSGKIVGGNKEQRSAVRKILKDYDTPDLVVSIESKLRVRGQFRRTGKTSKQYFPKHVSIALKPLEDVKDFCGVLFHELKHYLQYKANEPFSERKAQQFQIMKVNELFGTNWFLKHQIRTIYYGDGRVVKKNHKYMEIIKSEVKE